MLPYVEFHSISLGPLTLQVWGLLVALGFLAAAFAAAKLAEARGLKGSAVFDMLGWIILSAIIFARLFHVLLYEPGYYAAAPGEIMKIWEGGMSMYGGFFGGLLAGLIYLRKKKLDPWRYADVVCFGLPLGIFIGRIGCFLIHDHPGTATSFFLGVQYPDGIVRHDLGLYESLYGLVLFVLFFGLAKRKAPQGTYVALFCITYGLFRFLMDSLRVFDMTYIGLTPAQYLSVLLIAFGGYVWHRSRVS
jgi:phosphatidylglycerol:prolipoprotein diacylglycerol transferase